MKKMPIGTLIENARIALGYSREFLGQEIGVATTTVLRWEQGTRSPSFDNVVELSKALRQPLEYFSGEESMDFSQATNVKKLFLSDFARRLGSIPDDVFEMVEDLGPKHKVWEIVRGAHDAYVKTKKTSKEKHA